MTFVPKPPTDRKWYRDLDIGRDAAFVGSAVIAAATNSYWPLFVWLATSLGCAFDRKWQEPS